MISLFAIDLPPGQESIKHGKVSIGRTSPEHRSSDTVSLVYLSTQKMSRLATPKPQLTEHCTGKKAIDEQLKGGFSVVDGIVYDIWVGISIPHYYTTAWFILAGILNDVYQSSCQQKNKKSKYFDCINFQNGNQSHFHLNIPSYNVLQNLSVCCRSVSNLVSY